ncbi:helix-turn-helix domain-containing protein [Maribacter spongiicola]|uniref:helix-turn-helix domain-containing protein n=1 Tax=Maribacter spongiicola TaxID=1206753 RepID=UPI003F96BF56
MENPFEIINQRLERIEQLLDKLISQNINDSKSNDNKPMTAKELGIYLNLSVYTIYGLVHKRSIPFIKKGKRLYFQKRVIDEWLEYSRQLTREELEVKADEYLLRNPL